MEGEQQMLMAEVAKAAGVSTATVSRVLNDVPGVRSETVLQVRATLEAMKYTPQRVRSKRRTAGTTAVPRTGNIAVVTLGHTREWLQMPVMAAVMGGILRAAGELRLRVILDELPDLNICSRLIEQRLVDGGILFLANSNPMGAYRTVVASLREKVPVVWTIGAGMVIEGLDHVTLDNVQIGHLAYQYLRDKQCEEVAFITAEPGWPLMRQRGQAFLNAAYDDLRPATAYLVTSQELVADAYGKRVVTADSLDKIVESLAKTEPRPDGLFAANDLTVARLYPLLTRHGLRPGRDITIVSCDNEQARLSALDPRPMSIDVGAEDVGAKAVARLLVRLERPNDPPVSVQVLPRLPVTASETKFSGGPAGCSPECLRSCVASKPTCIFHHDLCRSRSRRRCK